MTQKSEIGILGENIACEYLRKKGYLVIERNFRKPWGELDIITKHKDGTLVFVEVKTLKGSGGLIPENNLTGAKLKKLQRTASLYAGFNENFIDKSRGWRIDLVAIDLLTENKKDGVGYTIRHLENI